MLRFCPKKVKEKFKIGKFEVLDILGLLITGVIVVIVLLFGGIPTSIASFLPKAIIGLIVGIVGFLLNFPLEADSPRLRSYVGSAFKYIFRHKRYESVKLEKDLGIEFEDYVLKNASRNQYMIAVEVKANLFLLKDEGEQDTFIDDLAKSLKAIKRGTILKEDIPINVSDYFIINKAKQDEFFKLENCFKYNGYNFIIEGKEVINPSNNLLEPNDLNISYEEETYNYEIFKNLSPYYLKTNVYRCLDNNNIYLFNEDGVYKYTGEYTSLSLEEKMKMVNYRNLHNKNARAERVILKEEEVQIKNFLTHEYRNPRYFILLYSSKKDELIGDGYNLLSSLKESHFDAEICSKETLKKMIRYYYDGGIDEDGDIVLNRWKENGTNIVMNVGKDENGKNIYKKYHSFAINTMPRQTKNGWLANLTNLQGVKMSMKLMENDSIVRSKNQLSSSIMELKMQLNRPQKVYEREELEWQVKACNDLISDLNAGYEVLRDVYIQFLVPTETLKDFLNQASLDNLHIDRLYFNQADTYLNNDVYKFMNIKPPSNLTLKLPTSVIGSSYVFAYPTFFDGQGELIGDSLGYPVFFDQFYNLNSKTNLRVNANISITGTSGVGKSYLSKILLTNASTIADKIRILDPENEYDVLCKNLYGKNINVSGGLEIINPLQIFPTLGEGEISNDVTLHKQFLDEFFKTCIRKVQQDDLISSYLNHCVDLLYSKWGYVDGVEITDEPDKYPIMQDLYAIIQEEYDIECSKNHDDEARYYKELLVLLSSFVKSEVNGKEFEGAKSRMWNGKTTLKLDNRVIVFNFQNLLSSNNKDISAAQMLLVMKFLNQEIILNKNNNFKNGTHNKVIIMVDEAHNFISKDYPVALTFLYRMSKQIRKYDGSLMITTQQINDFLGGDENTAKLAKGIIANCQYSFIFGNPNAINEVKNLYGEIMRFTEDELAIIRNNKRGECLFQLSPSCRTILNVSAIGKTNEFFDNKSLTTYLESEECEQNINNLKVKNEELKEEQEEKSEGRETDYKIVDKNGWIYYLSSDYKSLNKEECGKWSYHFKDYKFACEVAKYAIENGVCVETKMTSGSAKKIKEGDLFFYLNASDPEGHRNVLSFMLDNKLITKDKKGKLANIKFSYDRPLIKTTNGETLKKEIYLSNFVDLNTGGFI